MTLKERISKINQLHRELATMLSERSFDERLKALGDLQVSIQVFLTNSGVDRELYESDPGYRAVQNSLDHDRLQLVKTLLDIDDIVLVMGDPRLDKPKRYKYVIYNDDEGEDGPWVHQAGGDLWRAEQAEAWLYQVYLDYIRQKHVNETRLIFVSAYPDPPYHRVRRLEDLPEDFELSAKPYSHPND